MNKNLKWIVFFVCLCAVCISVLVLNSLIKDKRIAVISQDGKIIKTVDLSEVKTPYDIRISGEDGSYNIITVQKGKIAVTDANCPDKLCVHQGYIVGGDAPIVCLPHKLTVTVKTQSALDAVAGGN